jgi:hypothetical protein
MQSRWWDFGGNTIVRVDKYAGSDFALGFISRVLILSLKIHTADVRPPLTRGLDLLARAIDCHKLAGNYALASSFPLLAVFI